MKKLFLAATALTLLAATAHAATCTTAICKTDGTLTVNSGGTLTAASGSTVSLSGTNTIGGTLDVSGVTYSTTITGNPLMQNTMQTVTTASANAGIVLLSGVSGKKIYPGAVTMYVSGTAGGATAVVLECSGGTDAVSWPIAMLTTLQPVDAFVSKGGAVATRGTPLVSGCPAGESLQVSNNGTLTTTTHLYFNIPYTVQ